MSPLGPPMYRCVRCGYEGAYAPRCPACETPNALLSAPAPAPNDVLARGGRARPVLLRDVEPEKWERFSLGLVTLDEAFGRNPDGQGGIVRGKSYILAGTDGSGKSTLGLLLAHATGGLYATTLEEETVEEIQRRAHDHGHLDVPVHVVSSVEDILHELEEARSEGSPYRGLVIDSLHGLQGSDTPKGILENASTLVQAARKEAFNLALCCIGQLVKDETIAGPRKLPYLFHCRIFIDRPRDPEGAAPSSPDVLDQRFLRFEKNRMGRSVSWRLRMTGHGLDEPLPTKDEPPPPGTSPTADRSGANLIDLAARRRRRQESES